NRMASRMVVDLSMRPPSKVGQAFLPVRTDWKVCPTNPDRLESLSYQSGQTGKSVLPVQTDWKVCPTVFVQSQTDSPPSVRTSRRQTAPALPSATRPSGLSTGG